MPVFSQNVGIGTTMPLKEFSVAGSIAVDHNNANTGSLGRDALVFGTNPSLVGISSNKMPGEATSYGLEFWTNGIRRMLITENGRVSIATSYPDPSYDLTVAGHIKAYNIQAHNLNASVNTNIENQLNVGNKIAVNGPAYNQLYRLTVNDGNSYFGGNGLMTGYLTVEGEINANDNLDVSGDIYCINRTTSGTIKVSTAMSVGGEPDPQYKLRVYNGDSRFGGDVLVLGDLNVDDIVADEITIDKINGKGIVRSNGTSSLRLGFDQVWVNYTLNGGAEADLTVNISEFTTGPNNVRVFISQFEPDPLPQFVTWHDFSFHVHSVDPATNTCKVRVTNTTNGSLSIRGYLYLTSVAKD